MKTYSMTPITFAPEHLDPRNWIGEVFETVKQLPKAPSSWRERIRYRSELRRLINVGSHMIRDVGLVWEDAQLEVDKPFWQD